MKSGRDTFEDIKTADQTGRIALSADDGKRRGCLAPTPEVLAHAREVLALFQASALAGGLVWQDPHLGCNERGEVTLEWWWQGRTLTVFVRSNTTIHYLKSWGANIVSEMEDGKLTRIADFVRVARWLYEEAGEQGT